MRSGPRARGRLVSVVLDASGAEAPDGSAVVVWVGTSRLSVPRTGLMSVELGSQQWWSGWGRVQDRFGVGRGCPILWIRASFYHKDPC